MRINIKRMGAEIEAHGQGAGKEKAAHILNRKANAKLDYVTSVFTEIPGDICRVKYDGFLHKKLEFSGLYRLQELSMAYELQNRFFAIIYDLNYDLDVPVSATDDGDYSFGISYDGIMKRKEVRFAAKGRTGELEDAYLRNLNIPLILDRIKALDLLDFIIIRDAAANCFKVRCKSMVGSATWNLIPPVFYVIKPKRQECVMLIELFELIIDALQNPEYEAVSCKTLIQEQ